MFFTVRSLNALTIFVHIFSTFATVDPTQPNPAHGQHRYATFIGTVHIVSVHLSVRLSVPALATAANFAAVAWPAGDIDRLLHGAQQRGVRGRMRVVPRCQRT